MNKDKYVFSQITSLLNRSLFNDYVRKYHGDKYVKHFTCWNQLLVLMFGQLSNRESLRDYDVETLVPAFVHITTAAVHDVKAMDVIPYEPGSFYIFDRGYNDFKRLYRINVLDSFFVIRSKGNLKYRIVKWKRRLPKNVLSDAEIELTGYYPSKNYPERMRLIRYWDEEQGREFMFLTNAIGLSALLIAELYKNRWQIELFFKWLKQHLKIKKFWGTSENAVKTQIYVAIITFCLVAVVQHDMRIERSTYEVLQILSISLTDKTPLRDLFDKTDYHDVKEQIDNSELLLF